MLRFFQAPPPAFLISGGQLMPDWQMQKTLFLYVFQTGLEGSACSGISKHNDTVKYQNNLMCNKCFCSGLTEIDEKKITQIGLIYFQILPKIY